MILSRKLLMRYRELKQDVPDCLLLMQVGAFMQLLGEDARAESEVTGLTLQMAGMAWIAVIAAPGVSYLTMIGPMAVSGAGLALAIPAVTKSVVGSVAPGDIGKASGSFSTMRQLGGAFGVAILAAVFAAIGSYASATAFSNGFAPAMGAASGLALAGAVAGLILPSRPRAVRPPAAPTQSQLDTRTPATTR